MHAQLFWTAHDLRSTTTTTHHLFAKELFEALTVIDCLTTKPQQSTTTRGLAHDTDKNSRSQCLNVYMYECNKL